MHPLRPTTSLAKEAMFSVALVCLLACLFFVCLSVSNITQQVMDGLRWNFMEGSGVVKGTSNWVDFNEIFWIALQWHM